MRPEVDCPNGCGEMETFTSEKDLELTSPQGNTIIIGRMHVLACPVCYYEEKQWSD